MIWRRSSQPQNLHRMDMKGWNALRKKPQGNDCPQLAGSESLVGRMPAFLKSARPQVSSPFQGCWSSGSGMGQKSPYLTCPLPPPGNSELVVLCFPHEKCCFREWRHAAQSLPELRGRGLSRRWDRARCVSQRYSFLSGGRRWRFLLKNK